MNLDRRSFLSSVLGIGAAAAVGKLPAIASPEPLDPKLSNVLVRPHGDVRVRPGFEFVCEVPPVVNGEPLTATAIERARMRAECERRYAVLWSESERRMHAARMRDLCHYIASDA